MRVRILSVTAICILAIGFITACQTQEAVTVDDIIGIWLENNSFPFIHINQDGTYAVSPSKEIENAYQFGEFELDGKILIFHADVESEFCPGDSDSWEIESISEDTIELQTKEVQCEGLQPGSYSWVRVSP